MTNLVISDDLDLLLERAALQSGVSKNELAEDILRRTVDDESLPLSAFTEEQLTRLKRSFAQVEHGECTVTSEDVDAQFEKFFQELDSR